MLKLNIFLLVFVAWLQGVSAQKTEVFFNKADAFFKTYITNGNVEYRALKEDAAFLKEVLHLAKDLDVSSLPPDTYKAFWINVYNLLVIAIIVEHYPVQSPLDIDGFFDKTKHYVGGKNVTLNQIENQLLHSMFPKEARFHFVLVCGGKGCPPIIPEAYRPERLKFQIERQTKKAVNDPNFIKVTENEIAISQIFEWYKKYFELAGGIRAFLNRYRTEKLPSSISVSFYTYDWTLNAVH